MNLRNLCALMIAVLALSAAWATSASAAITTERAEFYVKDPNERTLPVGTETPLDARVVDHTGTGAKFTLKGSLGVNKVPIHFTATGLECVECKATNMEVTGKAGAIAVGTGRLTFTGVTAHEPVGCVVSSETGVEGHITTKPLWTHWDFMHEGKAFVHFFPEEGNTLATLKLNKGGCTAIAGSYNLTGSFYGEMKNKTGVFALEQEVEFSPAIQTTTGASVSLANNPAELTGTAAFSLTNPAGTKIPFAVKP